MTYNEAIVRKLKSWSIFLGIIFGAFTITAAVLLLMFNITNYAISFAALSATIWMIFSKKLHSEDISYRTLIGAYLIVGVFGIISTYFIRFRIAKAVLLLLAVIMMKVIDSTHGPSIGMLLSFLLNDFTIFTTLLVTSCVIFLIVISKEIKKVMENPSKYRLEIRENKVRFKFRKKEKGKFLFKNNVEVY